MGLQPGQDLQPFRSLSGFVSTLQTIGALVSDRDPSTAPLPLASKAICIFGKPRPDCPEAFIYQAPHILDHPALLQGLIDAIPLINDKADRARCLYLAVQLIHPLEDANGRTGRILHQGVMADLRWNARALADLVARSPFAREGTSAAFEEQVVHPYYPVLRLGQYGVFANLFGRPVAQTLLGVINPEMDRLNMKQLAEVCFGMPGYRPEVLESLGAEISQINRAFAPVKLALLKMGLESPSKFPHLKAEPATMQGLPVLEMTGVVPTLNSLSFPQVKELLSECRILGRELVEHLLNCFLRPAEYPPMHGKNGEPVWFKDTFDTNRFPELRRPLES
ncbi:MAG: Fic family protein [Deltaproteobacteria bacterium]|nr:Fic family protein [Deltaproteobacteria bacterium]